MDINKPGQIKSKELWNINYKRMQRFTDKIIPLFDISKDSKCLDIGEINPKMEYIKSKLSLLVDQAKGVDFNFASYGLNYYDVVFALEVIEHLQNPLFFMNELKKCLKENGSIYVTMPCNPRWLWVGGHYFEIPPNHFNKWIVEPLGLKITKYKRIYHISDLKGIFIGFRPLMRVLRGDEHWKTLIRKFLYFKYDFYEIKKADL